MFSFLHNYIPDAVLGSFGPMTLHWYGLLMLLAIIAGLMVTLKLASRFGIKKNDVWDLSFWLVLGAIIGARVYEVFLFFDYYRRYPSDIIMVWQGGLAIHGAWLGGLLVLLIFCRRRKLPILKILDLVSLGLILGQAIGRWGNYFNQELFGTPTNLPWGIPISVPLRPIGLKHIEYFHPTFLYESILNFVVFGLMWIVMKFKKYDGLVFFSYLFLYSVIRFSLEYIRLDDTSVLLGLRWPQIMSVIAMLVSVAGFVWIIWRQKYFRSAQ